LRRFLLRFFGDVEVMLDAVGLQVADAGGGHRRDPAAGEEEHAHQRQVAFSLAAYPSGSLSSRSMACRCVSDGVEFSEPGALMRQMSWAVTQRQAIDLLEATPTDTLQGKRDLALMSVFFLTGCRVSA